MVFQHLKVQAKYQPMKHVKRKLKCIIPKMILYDLKNHNISENTAIIIKIKVLKGECEC